MVLLQALADIMGAEVGCLNVLPPDRGSIFYLQVRTPPQPLPRLLSSPSALKRAPLGDPPQLEVPVLPVPMSLLPTLERAEAQRVERQQRSIELRGTGDLYAPIKPASLGAGSAGEGRRASARAQAADSQARQPGSDSALVHAPAERLTEAAMLRTSATDALEATLQWAMARPRPARPARTAALPPSRRTKPFRRLISVSCRASARLTVAAASSALFSSLSRAGSSR